LNSIECDILQNVMHISGGDRKIAGRIIYETSEMPIKSMESGTSRKFEGTNLTILQKQKMFIDECSVKRKLSLFLRKELDNFIGSELVKDEAQQVKG